MSELRPVRSLEYQNGPSVKPDYAGGRRQITVGAALGLIFDIWAVPAGLFLLISKAKLAPLFVACLFPYPELVRYLPFHQMDGFPLFAIYLFQYPTLFALVGWGYGVGSKRFVQRVLIVHFAAIVIASGIAGYLLM